MKIKIEESIKSVLSSMTDADKKRWEEINGVELRIILEDEDRMALLSSLLEAML
ncbi:MAG: hypothetical protein H8D67_26145 [Deltaproteobacteria bacterium]|nr:hypothetical protein [Deltaproteobacteria bacterium]